MQGIKHAWLFSRFLNKMIVDILSTQIPEGAQYYYCVNHRFVRRYEIAIRLTDRLTPVSGQSVGTLDVDQVISWRRWIKMRLVLSSTAVGDTCSDRCSRSWIWARHWVNIAAGRYCYFRQIKRYNCVVVILYPRFQPSFPADRMFDEYSIIQRTGQELLCSFVGRDNGLRVPLSDAKSLIAQVPQV